jgi:hypothetical protein
MSRDSRPQHIARLQPVALVVACLLLGVVGCGDDDDKRPAPTPTATATPSPTPTTPPCDLPPPFCGGDFPLNTLQTTSYGPAWADVTLEPQDFVPCFGPYALCFYANCTVGPDGSVSDCPCYEWYGTSYVLTTAILNLDLYQATISQCSADPSSCQVPNGAPVCAAINSGTFLNGAERISTFSFYRAKEEPLGNKDCSDQPGLYAGCMTGPCFGPVTTDPTQKTATIHCDCPNFDGPYQIGQSDVSCDDAPRAWSASYHPNQVPPDPCDRVVGCVPDAPEDSCGCPLYQPGTTVLPPGSGVDCDLVCQQYASCTKAGDIQLGFTCDATICTSNDHDLVFAACLGLEQCELGEVFKAEMAAQCSCCASQLCGCEPDGSTNAAIFALNADQRADGDTPQCDINGTLCGAVP